MTMFANHVGAETSRFNDFVGATFAIGKLSNSSSSGVAINLDASHNKVANSKGNGGARGIGAFTMNSTTLFGKQSKDLFGELGSRASKTKEGMNIGGLLLSRSRSWRKAEVKRETKRPTDSRNTANNISAVNMAAVPGVGGSMGSFDEDGVSATIVAGNSNSFIQETVEMFNTNSFVVATSSDVDIDIENRADGFEEAFESAAVVDDD
jgi:hypothetical protein